MGKVLIVLNVAGLVVNVLVFVIVVDYFENVEQPAEAADGASGPIAKAELERLLVQQSAKINQSIQAVSQKFRALTKDLKSVSTELRKVSRDVRQIDTRVADIVADVGEVEEPPPQPAAKPVEEPQPELDEIDTEASREPEEETLPDDGDTGQGDGSATTANVER